MYFVQGGASGYKKPVALRDRAGHELTLGMYWDFDADQWRTPDGADFGALHGISAAPVDWDGDGDFDLIAGTADGKLYRWTNHGTAKATAFAEGAEPVLAADTPLSIRGGHAMPLAADWDQDGLFDLVIGGDDGAVAWARNVGRAGTPVFAALQELLPPAKDTKGRSGRNAQVEVADLNGDGLVDLLVGDHQSELPRADWTPEMDARTTAIQGEFAQYAADWKVLTGKDAAARAALDPARVAAFDALMKEYRALGPKHRTEARVWFYERRPPLRTQRETGAPWRG